MRLIRTRRRSRSPKEPGGGLMSRRLMVTCVQKRASGNDVIAAGAVEPAGFFICGDYFSGPSAAP